MSCVCCECTWLHNTQNSRVADGGLAEAEWSEKACGTWGYFNSFFLEATRGLKKYCCYPDCQTCLCKVWSDYLLSVISLWKQLLNLFYDLGRFFSWLRWFCVNAAEWGSGGGGARQWINMNVTIALSWKRKHDMQWIMWIVPSKWLSVCLVKLPVILAWPVLCGQGSKF